MQADTHIIQIPILFIYRVLLKVLSTLKNWIKKLKVSDAVALIVGLPTFVMLLFLYSELKEVRKQNEFLQSQDSLLRVSLIQSFKPLGVIRQSFSDETLALVLRFQSPEMTAEDEIGFALNLQLKNLGKGTLVLNGFVTYLSPNRIYFRKSLYEGRVTLGKDNIPKSERRFDIAPDEIFRFQQAYTEIPWNKSYFAYSIFFYEDRDGNHYDTQLFIQININYLAASYEVLTKIINLSKQSFGELTPI